MALDRDRTRALLAAGERRIGAAVGMAKPYKQAAEAAGIAAASGPTPGAGAS